MEPLTIHSYCMKKYGNDFLTWGPQGRVDVLEKDLGTKIPHDLQNMMEAMVTLSVTDIAYKRWPVFEKVVWALNNHVPRMDLLEVPPSYYISYALHIMDKISKTSLDDQVIKYIAAALANEGFCYAPPPMDKAQKDLDKFLEDKSLSGRVESEWKKMDSSNPQNMRFNYEDPVSAQVNKIVVIGVYLDRKAEILKEENYAFSINK